MISWSNMYIYHNRTTGQITLHARPHGPVLDTRPANSGLNLDIYVEDDIPTLGGFWRAYVAADDSWRLASSHRIVAG